MELLLRCYYYSLTATAGLTIAGRMNMYRYVIGYAHAVS
jgi:hypothetical protein